METKNYAKISEKWDFSTINVTIFSLKKRSNCSLNTLANLVTDRYSTFWFFTDASCQSCQSCQTHFGNLSNPLINYIFKIYNYIRALTDFSFSVWQLWQLWQLRQLATRVSSFSAKPSYLVTTSMLFGKNNTNRHIGVQDICKYLEALASERKILISVRFARQLERMARLSSVPLMFAEH